MLLSETDFQIEMLYMGPAKGCKKILRCDQIGFAREIDCSEEAASKSVVIEELEQCLYDKFVSSEFAFTDTKRQEKAQQIVELSDRDLIARAFCGDGFERSFTRRELVRRCLFDDELYRLGLHGDEFTTSQAVELLMQKAEVAAEVGEMAKTSRRHFEAKT